MLPNECITLVKYIEHIFDNKENLLNISWPKFQRSIYNNTNKFCSFWSMFCTYLYEASLDLLCLCSYIYKMQLLEKSKLIQPNYISKTGSGLSVDQILIDAKKLMQL